MLKITAIGETYCLSCGENEEGVLLSYEDRLDLIDSVCVRCERVLI